MKKIVISLFILISILLLPTNIVTVKAQTLEEEINSQLSNVDFSEFNTLYEQLGEIYQDYDFFSFVSNVLKGNLNADYDSMFSYFFSTFIGQTYNFIPIALTILAISLLTGIMSKLKSGYLSDGVEEIISLICVFLTITLIFNHFISVYKSAVNVIDKVSKLNQVVSPILLTLMIASGGSVSASVYKPIVSLLSGSIINIFITVLIPLVGLMTVLMIISNFSENIKLNKFLELITSIIKWVIGISVAIFGIFLTAQGIVASVHDGISFRATKYAISNSIPLIGGFLSNGLDLVLSGSILIKNAIGISSIFLLVFLILTPVLNMLSLSLVLKVCSGFSECFDNVKISSICSTLSKCITYLIVIVLMVGFMFFITLLLMIFSANTFI